MSLVGTRPPTLDEWEKYEPHHRARMSFRPGLTGLWQVSGRSNITDFEEVVKLDTQYIGEWSVKNDLRIILLTIKSVFNTDCLDSARNCWKQAFRCSVIMRSSMPAAWLKTVMRYIYNSGNALEVFY